jgi:hypothetical protein
MQQPLEPPRGLHELQAAFGRGLSAGSIAGADLQLLAPDAGAAPFALQFDVYRNNAWQFFHAALERTFPVVQKRVGEEFFRQLAREYRQHCPSRHGDLHWVGAGYPAWLAVRLADTGYEWLAELARLEWACEESIVAGSAAALELDQLAAFEPEAMAHLELRFQPSLRAIDSPYPIWTVWQSNQGDDDTAGPTDLAQGGEHCGVACVADRSCVYRLDPPDYRLLQRLMAGECFGDAIVASGSDAEVLTRLLAWVFTEELVVGISTAAAA